MSALTPEQKQELKAIFPYKYVGGGYFRAVNKEGGGKAYKILHGEEAIEFLFLNIRNSESK